MENNLADNIRKYRKNLGLTQEQLAERLGITLGAVSKWERGSSEPDLSYIMDLAELFHVSVDALIGYSMRGANADEEAERLEEMVSQGSFGEVEAEYNNALRKFPNHFRIVLGAAAIHRRYGAMHKDETYLKRALELYRHALELISQNTCQEISEVVLRNEIAGCYSELKDYRRAVEEYRKNNVCGNADADIGLLTIRDEKKPEEGITFTARAFANSFGTITGVMNGFFYYYMQTGDRARGLRTVEWTIAWLRSLKEDPEKRSYLDKILSMAYLLRAVVRDTDGQTEAAAVDLRTAVETAWAFDADPVFTLENVVFTEKIRETVYVYDSSGPTALEGLRDTLKEADAWVSEAFRRKFEEETVRALDP